MGALPDPADPAEMRHGAWCATPGTLAPEVRMTVVLNKLLQKNLSKQLQACCDVRGLKVRGLKATVLHSTTHKHNSVNASMDEMVTYKILVSWISIDFQLMCEPDLN